MTTQNSPRSRIIAVWLVLIAFLCGVMVPTLAIAKEDMAIATEGDPDDGLDSSGGGGSFDDPENSSTSRSDFQISDGSIQIFESGFIVFGQGIIWIDSQLGIHVFYPSSVISDWRVRR